MQRIFAIFLLTLYTFSVGTEVIFTDINPFDISHKVSIKKQCKNYKGASRESEKLPFTIFSGEKELVNLQVIQTICVTTTIAPHFNPFSSTLIPDFITWNTFKISESYDSPSLFRDPFPPRG